MTFAKYVKDRIINILLAVFLTAIVCGILVIFRLNPVAVILVTGLMIIVLSVSFLIDFFRKKNFYDSLLDNVRRMDKAYLVLETIEEPQFLEGRILYDALFDIDKSMAENVAVYTKQSKEFAEYIEMWIHEVKLPLSAISLKLHNLVKQDGENTEEYKKLLKETRRIEEYVNQVLYFVRSENAEKDYHIAKVSITDIIHEAAMTYRETLRDNGIDFVIDQPEREIYVNTDRKWILFIIGQLISNSIKYKKDNTDSYVKIYVDMGGTDGFSSICIEDNGIGIPPEDMGRIFDKSFTGTNGRLRTGSTGMGLYIVSELAEKLGHGIKAESEPGEYTKMSIIWSKKE